MPQVEILHWVILPVAIVFQMPNLQVTWSLWRFHIWPFTTAQCSGCAGPCFTGEEMKAQAREVASLKPQSKESNQGMGPMPG